MSARDVYLNFGAETGPLEAAFAKMQAVIRSTTAQMRSLAGEMVKTGASADSDMGQRLGALGERLAGAKAQARAAQEEISKLGGVASGAARGVESVAHASGNSRIQMMESVHVVKSLADSIMAGQSPLRALAVEGGRIGQILTLGVSPSIGVFAGIAASVAAAAGAVAYLVYQAHEFQATSQQLRTSAAFGGFGISPGQSDALTRQLSAVSGLSNDDAQKTVTALGLMQSKSRETFTAITADISTFAEATSQKPVEAAQTLIGLFDNEKLSADELAKTLGGLSEAQRALYTRAVESANPVERQAALQAILAQKLAATRQETLRLKEAELAAAEARKARDDQIIATNPELAGYARNELSSVNVMISALQREIEALKQANVESAAMADSIRQSASAADLLKQKFDEVLASVSGASAAANLQSQIDTLRAGLQGATGDAATLIRHFEGFRPTAQWDRNHWRVGYMSDETTSASGAVGSVGEGTVTTREDAERDLARRIAEIQARLAADLGASWTAISDKARASLTSVAYNYGRLPRDIAAAARTGNDRSIADAIAGHAGDNGGINAGRRAQEAANITRDYAAVTDPAKAAEATDALGALVDKQRQLNDAKNGGGVVDQAELRNLEAEVAGRTDAVAEAKAMVAARERELQLAQSVQAKVAAEKALAEAKLALSEKQDAIEESRLKLNVARANGTGDLEKRKAAEMALANWRIDQADGDVAATNAAEAQKLAIVQRYASEERAIKLQAAQQRIADARAETQARLKELDLELKAKQITEGQKTALTQAAYARERALALAAYQQELQIEGLKPQERQRILHEMEAFDREYAVRARELQLQAADESARAWDGAMRKINSAVESQIPGLLKGTTSWAQAVRDSLASLITDVIKFYVDWGLQDAENYARRLATNAGLIASDTATQAAATAAHASGAAATKAIDATTIQGDASRAAAGAYAAVAGVPLIGPVLAPAAAAAAYAGTLAFNAFDIGAWSIPQNQLAMVHRNELVMPAAEAGAFRSMLSDHANGGAPAGATNVHLHYGPSVQAMDASGVAGVLQTHGEAIARHIADQFNRNPALRPKY